jgi:hypothetical protein
MSAARRFAARLGSVSRSRLCLLAAATALVVLQGGGAETVAARQARQAGRPRSALAAVARKPSRVHAPTSSPRKRCSFSAARRRRRGSRAPAGRGGRGRASRRGCSRPKRPASLHGAGSRSALIWLPGASQASVSTPAESAPAPAGATLEEALGSAGGGGLLKETSPEGGLGGSEEAPDFLEGSQGSGVGSGSPEGGSGSLEGSQGSSGGGSSPPEGSQGSSAGSSGSLGSVEGGSGSSDGSSAPTEHPTPARLFASTSFWNELVPANAPLDSMSAELVGAFSAAIASDELVKDPPWINTTSASVPVYTVPASQPTVRVKLAKAATAPALQAAWGAVPLPAGAQPAVGTDKVLVVWQPSTDQLWDFWRLVHSSEGWSASWGGAMQHVASNPGVYGPEAWPGAKPWWGDSASSLEPVGGLISLEDLELGEINHALAIAIPNVRAGVYASPAQRTDGRSADPLALPEGVHLRLDPTLDLAALHLPRLTLMIAEAAQRYGLFVRDYSPDVAFYAQDPIPTGTNPYAGPTGYFEGKNPRELLEAFPWSHLQVLKMELHSSP